MGFFAIPGGGSTTINNSTGGSTDGYETSAHAAATYETIAAANAAFLGAHAPVLDGYASKETVNTISTSHKLLQSGNTRNFPFILQNLDTTASSALAAIGMEFDLADTSANTIAAGRLAVGKEAVWTSTIATQDGYMISYVAQNGSLVEGMRVNSDKQVVHSAGTAALPAMTFSGTLDRGFYADTINAGIGVSVGGAQRVSFTGSNIISTNNADGLPNGVGQLVVQNPSTTSSALAKAAIDFQLATTAGANVNAGRILAGKDQTWTSTATTQDGYLSFETATDGTLLETMRLKSTGTTAHAGDVYIDNSSKGFVSKDANGHYWRLIVSTGGVLSTTDLGATAPS